MAVVSVLIVLNFANPFYGFRVDQERNAIAYDLTALELAYAEVADSAAPERSQQAEIGCACQPATIQNSTIFEDIPALRRFRLAAADPVYVPDAEYLLCPFFNELLEEQAAAAVQNAES